LHRQAQDEFTAFRANPVAKPSHQAGIDGQVVAKILFTAEVLPVGVLSPSGHNFFIADVTQVLEQLQANHQADGMAGPANACCIQAAELALQSFPINLACQHTQLVAQIDQVDQLLAKQINIGVVKGLAQCHKFASFEVNMTSKLAIFVPPNMPLTRMDAGLVGFIRDDYLMNR